ncbi:MAG: hypothetical protein GHCLOJNM_02293 [bacterium]|nr:hypothetical protein [bacterium]
MTPNIAHSAECADIGRNVAAILTENVFAYVHLLILAFITMEGSSALAINEIISWNGPTLYTIDLSHSSVVAVYSTPGNLWIKYAFHLSEEGGGFGIVARTPGERLDCILLLDDNYNLIRKQTGGYDIRGAAWSPKNQSVLLIGSLNAEDANLALLELRSSDGHIRVLASDVFSRQDSSSVIAPVVYEDRVFLASRYTGLLRFNTNEWSVKNIGHGFAPFRIDTNEIGYWNETHGESFELCVQDVFSNARQTIARLSNYSPLTYFHDQFRSFILLLPPARKGWFPTKQMRTLHRLPWGTTTPADTGIRAFTCCAGR